MNAGFVIAMAWILAAVLMSLGWSWQHRTANAGIVDVLWALGVGIAAISDACIGDGALLPRATVALLGGAWGLRLASHLWRRVRGEPEDGRYRALRARWGHAPIRWFAFFQFQAALVVLFSLPFLAVVRNPVSVMTAWWYAGVLIWMASVFGEAIADRQLAGFRADTRNKGKTCRTGLWRYSRHPNYFFEWTHWFAYACLAVGSPWSWLAWSGPLVMWVFLRWISGIPFTEAQALRTRGADYADYQRTTSMLIPWFPSNRHGRTDTP